MKRWSKSFSYVLLAGTCIGLFLYLGSLPVIRLLSEAKSDVQMLWDSPSPAPLGLSIISANIGLLIVWFAYSAGYANVFNIPLKTALQADASTYLPFCSLAIALTQFNVLLVSYSDVFLLLTHSLRYVVLLAAVLGMVYLKVHNHRDFQRISPSSPSSFPFSGRKLSWKRMLTIFVLSFVIYGAAGKQITARLPLGGDEPHYLLLCHSLLHDHDLEIGSNYNQHDYRAFFAGKLNRHVSIGKDGTRYSIHPLGTALLLLPGYALAGRSGAVLTMNLLAALLAVVFYALAFAQTGRDRVALVVWGVASFTSPIFLYSSQLYPEIPSALLLGAAYYLIRFQRPFTWPSALLLGLCLMYLPWLHQRLILPTIVLTGYYLLVMGRRSWKRRGGRLRLSSPMLLPLILLALSGIVMAGYYYLLFGNPLPNAPYMSISRTSVFSWEVFFHQGLFGHLLDQEAGLLIFSPYYLFAIPGFLLLFRRQAFHALVVLVLVFSIYLPCAGFVFQWRGGWSPASRFMVALIPLLVLPLSLSLREITRDLYRYIFGFLTVIAVSWTVHFLNVPFAAIMSGRGVNRTFEQYARMGDLTQYFPSFSPTSTNEMLLTGAWGLVIMCFSVFAYRSALSSSASELAPPARRIKRVFACYGVGAGILVIFSGLAAHTQNDASSQRAQNEQILQFLSHARHERVFSLTVAHMPTFSDRPLRLTCMSRERVGNVDAHQGPRFLITGPRRSFPPGTYTAYFSLVVNPCPDDTPVATFDIVAERGTKIFAKDTFFGKDFPLKEQEAQIPIRFTLPPGVNDLETRVYFHNQVRILLKDIMIEPNLEGFYN
jgi:hypothetical protein